jgi:hypothetical protein
LHALFDGPGAASRGWLGEGRLFGPAPERSAERQSNYSREPRVLHRRILQKFRAETAPGKYTSTPDSSSQHQPLDEPGGHFNQTRVTAVTPRFPSNSLPMRGKIQLQGTRRAFAVHTLVLLCLLGTSSACGSKSKPVARSLPSYDAEQATLFGDVFRPELFGFGSEQSASKDGLLRDRASSADSIVVARVVTINRETRGSERGYSVVLMPAGSALAGTTPAGPLTFSIVENSPVFGWLEGAGTRWVGTRMLLFLREFQDGMHFFGSVDSQEVRAAIAAAPRATPIPP